MSPIFVNVNHDNVDFSEMERNLKVKHGLNVKVRKRVRSRYADAIRLLPHDVTCCVTVDISASLGTCRIVLHTFDPEENGFVEKSSISGVNLENVSDEIADAVKASGVTRKYVLR